MVIFEFGFCMLGIEGIGGRGGRVGNFEVGNGLSVDWVVNVVICLMRLSVRFFVVVLSLRNFDFL